MGIVLASNSPRRRELLEMAGITEFTVKTADCDESVPPGLTPEETVRRIALQKARGVMRLCDEDDTIIAADTLVYLGGRPFGKPCDADDAADMLTSLSGRGHSVYTGVALLKGPREMSASEMTRVFFREMSKSEIVEYVATGEPMDKAGAYGAQGRGAVFIERIEGDFFNVMGLPLCRLFKMLEKL